MALDPPINVNAAAWLAVLLALLVVPVPGHAQATSCACESRDVQRVVREAISVREACDRVFPDLRATTAGALSRIETAFKQCYDCLLQPGQDRNLQMLASQLIENEMRSARGNERGRNTCAVELPEGVARVLEATGKKQDQ